MHSDEPMEPRTVTDPGHQVIADAVWRAELAFRVCSYRARRRRRIDGETTPALDFGPDSAAQTFGGGADAAPNPAAAQPSRTQAPALARRNTIDTNYYRRLNAESIAQDSGMQFDATVAATAVARDYAAALPGENLAAANDVSPCGTQPDALDSGSAGNSVLDLEIRPTAAADPSLDRYRISAPQPEPEPKPPARPVQGNLIVFRRPLIEPPLLPQPSRDELAEPMNNRPRILEVPEDIIPAAQGSLFPEIHLDADREEGSTHREPHIEIPLQVAPLSQRLFAALLDWLVVMAAGLLFAAMAIRALPGVPHAKPLWMALAAATLLWWAIYQYLFLLFGGRTFGMSVTGIRLSAFDGGPPPWKQRSRRARFMFVSSAAVALGFLWALVDEDALCWHDRISRTFPTRG
jgi:uncharacterized RDD family membrane protein YckC